MEKRTLTSVVALTFLMTGTATFAMDDDKQNKHQYVYSLPQNFKKGDQLEILIDAKEGDVLPFMSISINENVSTGNFLSGYKNEVKKHVIGSVFEKKETISDENSIENISLQILSLSSSPETKKVEIEKNPIKKKGLFAWFNWFSTPKEEKEMIVLSQEDVNELPSDDAFLMAAIKMKETDSEFFESLMAYAVREEKRDNFKDVASKVRELSIQFKDTSNEELLKAKEIFQQEDLEKLSTYLKGFRERTLKKLQTAVSNQSFLSFDTLEMRPSVFFNPFDTILKLEEEKNVNQVTLSQLTDEKKVTEPKLNEPFKSVQSALGDHKILPIDYVGTYNERSNLGSSSGISYPKIPTIHTDHPDIQSSPFGAVFLGNEVAIPLSLKQYLPQKDQFFFLNIQQHDKNEEPLSLKPQYALFPGAPASSQDTQKTTVGWTIIPGVEGKIIPEQGETKDTLWKEEVSIHPTGENNDKLILSGNSMRLQGINTKKSMDCYSFIDADNATLLTYHWMLTPLDFENFNQVLSVSDTLNELIQNLDNKQFLPNILEQLKLYVKYN